MKVEYVQIPSYRGVIRNMVWLWRCGPAESMSLYTRRRDAVRGFERFCRAIEKARKA